MGDGEHFWRLEHLSDRQLLERVQGVLRTQRCALAELIAHLGEIEERRLHLVAAHSSLFSYCVQRLGMSEDEACRRIELARLARRFPLLFGELASGRISLSVALLLKPVLTPDNHAQLFAAARGASLRSAREMLAARFPSPDVPSRIRKLPERLVANAMAAAVAHAVPTCVTPPGVTTGATTASALTSSPQPARSPEFDFASLAKGCAQSLRQEPPTPATPSPTPVQGYLPRDPDPPQRIDLRQRIDPLSAERYRVQFTADASLKQKLELARDLLRHSNPSGDLAPIVSRALELLLQELMQRRFGVRRKEAHRAAGTAPHAAAPAAAPAPATPQLGMPQSSTVPVAMPASALPVATPSMTAGPTATPQSSTVPVALPASAPPAPVAAPPDATPVALTAGAATPSAASPSVAIGPAATLSAAPPRATTPTSHIARAARRLVLERDGLGCGWVDAAGNRCGSTAWLELDHRHPAGKGGGSAPENLRLLCHAHNRLAAERAYGRDHVERAIQGRPRHAKRRCPSGQAPSSSPAPA